MESCRKDHDCACTQHFCNFHQSNGVFLITSQFLDAGVSELSLHNLIDCERINYILFAAISKH